MPGKNVPEHNKIASQTIKWVNKSGGFIFFKKEMTEPCKAIAAKRNNDEPKPFAGDDSKDDTNKNQECAGEVQGAAHRVFVFG